MYKPFSLTFVIECSGKYYLGDDNPAHWGGLEAACLYTEGRAEQKLKELSRGRKCEMKCLVQDEHFNFFNGEEFVYDMSGARLYTSERGHDLAQELHDKHRRD